MHGSSLYSWTHSQSKRGSSTDIKLVDQLYGHCFYPDTERQVLYYMVKSADGSEAGASVTKIIRCQMNYIVCNKEEIWHGQHADLKLKSFIFDASAQKLLLFNKQVE